MPLIDSERFAGRVIILYVLITVPLWRMLIQHKYGIFYLEVFVIGLFALLPCLAGALIGRKAIYFYATVLFLIVLQSSNSVQMEFFPNLRIRWIILSLTVCVGTVMILMRKKFFPVLLIFLGGMLLVDLTGVLRGPAQALMARDRARNTGTKLQHVVYIIFDEFIGLEGIPTDIEGGLQVKSDLRNVLSKNHFTIYPFAFSNYRSTSDSIPSILNNRLLNSTGEYLSEAGKNKLTRSLLFEEFLKKGYSIRIYQSNYIDFSRGGISPFAVRTYKFDSLAAMHLIDMDWSKRLHQILTLYLQSDAFWWENYQVLLPLRIHPTRYRMAPLATQEVWPSALLADIKTARQNTLFFAHLLTPHYPYVYRRDGTVRNVTGWSHERNIEFYQETEYKHWYRNYLEQVDFLALQLEEFFHELRLAGVFESTMVVIHGDHGSRLRLLDEGERAARENLLYESHKCPPSNRYDYVSAPKLQDLLNRFSTLLAIKSAGATQPSEVRSRGSVLFFLRGLLWPSQSESQAVNRVYLFDAEGLPRGIPLREIWQERGIEGEQ